MQTGSVLRFLHATNLRLGHVVSGVCDVSATVKQQLLDAPWQAAEAVFDQAVAHDVDFVLLNGEVVPDGIERVRALNFLLVQFQKLQSSGIPVFWRTDTSSDEWNGLFDWPTNVQIVSDRSDQVFEKDGSLPVNISGSGGTRSNNFSIFLSNDSNASPSADYSAVCGTTRTDSVQAGHTAHCPGATQGLNFAEPGAHGCSLIDLDHNNCVAISFLETNAISWETLRVNVPDQTASLEDALRHHASASQYGTQFVNFVLDTRNSATALYLETINLNQLRKRLQPAGHTPGGYWVCDIELGAELTVSPGNAVEGSCLSDFRQLIHHSGEDCARSLAAQRALSTTTPQTQLLSRANRLAAELLS